MKLLLHCSIKWNPYDQHVCLGFGGGGAGYSVPGYSSGGDYCDTYSSQNEHHTYPTNWHIYIN